MVHISWPMYQEMVVSVSVYSRTRNWCSFFLAAGKAAEAAWNPNQRCLTHLLDERACIHECNVVHAEEDVMAGHHRVVMEPDGSERLVAFSSGEAGLDLTVKVLEIDEQGNKVPPSLASSPLCQHDSVRFDLICQPRIQGLATSHGL
jgi:hypothetical protein